MTLLNRRFDEVYCRSRAAPCCATEQKRQRVFLFYPHLLAMVTKPVLVVFALSCIFGKMLGVFAKKGDCEWALSNLP